MLVAALVISQIDRLQTETSSRVRPIICFRLAHRQPNYEGSTRNDISTVSLQEKQHDKGDYARGVLSGRVAEQHPLKQRLKPEEDKAHILRLVKDFGMCGS